MAKSLLKVFSNGLGIVLPEGREDIYNVLNLHIMDFRRALRESP